MARTGRSACVPIESYGGSLWPSSAIQLAFSRCRSVTSSARRAGQNSAPCGNAINSTPQNEKGTTGPAIAGPARLSSRGQACDSPAVAALSTGGGDCGASLSEGAVTHSMRAPRSEEQTSELQSLKRISYAVLCLKQKKDQ